MSQDVLSEVVIQIQQEKDLTAGNLHIEVYKHEDLSHYFLTGYMDAKCNVLLCGHTGFQSRPVWVRV